MFIGAFTALVTPMQNGQIFTRGLREFVEFQISEGIDGLVPCGTTGEAATLDASERAEVIRLVVEQARGRVPVIAGASANCTATAVANSRAAAEAGADALLHVTPYYNKPSQDGLVAHFTAVAGATDLPVVLYNVPGRTSCDMLPETVARLASLPNVVGVKEATGSLGRAQQVIAACPDDFDVLSGDDFTCMGMTALGGSGVISVVSTLIPGDVARMIGACRAGDMEQARTLHYRLEPLMHLLFVESNPVPVKAGVSLLGYTANEVRLPLLPLDPDNLAILEAEMKNLGVSS